MMLAARPKFTKVTKVIVPASLATLRGFPFSEREHTYGTALLHGPVTTWAGGDGGVIHGGFVKSKNSVMSIWAASRAVRFGTLNLVSMNRSIAVKSATV